MQINNNNNNYINNDVYLKANESLNKISSGQELNKTSDNPAALAIANDLLSQANQTSAAIENSNSAIALTQIADKAISEQSDILDSVKKNLLQAASDTTSDEGREALLKDTQALLKNLDNIADSTSYNNQTLLQNSKEDRSSSDNLAFQLGNTSLDTIDTSSIQSNTSGLNLEELLNADVSNFSAEDARGFLNSVDEAIETLNNYRAEFGSTQNQLKSSSKNLISQEVQGLNASSVYDTDYAKESSNFSKQNILAQVGAYGQAQANLTQSNVIKLLS